jgi:hypothetical protein
VEAGVAVERQFACWEMAGEPAEQRDEVVLREERDQPVRDDHRRAVRRHFVQPGRIGQICADPVAAGALRDDLAAGGDDRRKVDVVPSPPPSTA